jgi:membrane dipeptidase
MMTLPEAEQQKARAEFTELNKKYPIQLATVTDAIDSIILTTL